MEYLSLAAAARRIPPTGVSPSTIFRWIHNGLVVGDHRIRLRGKYLGRRLVTTQEWLDEFSSALTHAKLTDKAVDTPPAHCDDTEGALRARGLID